jgi:CRISPR-associated protein Cmr6
MADLRLPPLPKENMAALALLFAARAIPAGANAGLVFQRYPQVWTKDFPAPDSMDVRRFLTAFVKAFADLEKLNKPELLRQAKRCKQLADGSWDFTTIDRLAVGLGAEHPTQNGFTFDPVLGVPIIPGSSVRGLVRATGRAAGQHEDVERLLGSEPEARSPVTGRVAFLDAWPIHWPTLEVDIVNPHHPNYYVALQQWRTGKEPWPKPSMVEDPKPAFFLTVAPDISFRFGVRWRDNDKVLPDDRERLRSWLESGLAFLGVGAKTAAGYGRFEPRRSK